MPNLSKASRARLATTDPALQAIAHEAIKTFDFMVVCGHRGQAEQEDCVRRGTSRVHWPKSKHNKQPSLAMDCAPWVAGKIEWNDRELYASMAATIKAAAKKLGKSIVWGGDWKSFVDLPHFEIRASSEFRESCESPSLDSLMRPQPSPSVEDLMRPQPITEAEGGGKELIVPEKPLYSAEINAAALRFNLPVRLIQAMILIESGGLPWAMRYEPEFYDKYVAQREIKPLRPCSEATERRGRATSWGLMQIMGETARSVGFARPYLSELCAPDVGLLWACSYLEHLKNRFVAWGWSAVVAAYNGGPGAVLGAEQFTNPEYPRKVLAALGGEWPA